MKNLIKHRRWGSKLANLDNLLTWLVDKGIIKGNDAKRKHKACRRYYRYYNDGDIPSSLRHLEHNLQSLEIELERQTQETLVPLLEKYAGKYSRTQFRFEMKLEALIAAVQNPETALVSSTQYWVNSARLKNTAINAALSIQKELTDQYFAYSNEQYFASPIHKYREANAGRYISDKYAPNTYADSMHAAEFFEYDEPLKILLDKLGEQAIIINSHLAVEIKDCNIESSRAAHSFRLEKK